MDALLFLFGEWHFDMNMFIIYFWSICTIGIASDEIKGRVVESTLADLKDNSADKFWY